MGPAPIELNPTAGTVLGFLLDGPRSGWELDSAIEASVGNFWNVTRSQVYRELARLADAGLVEGGAAGRRERVAYEITTTGRAAFLDWVPRALPEETRRVPVLLTTFFGQHLPSGRLAELLEAHGKETRAVLDGYQSLRPLLADDPYTSATLAYGIAYAEMVERWLDEVALPLTRSATGGGIDAPR